MRRRCGLPSIPQQVCGTTGRRGSVMADEPLRSALSERDHQRLFGHEMAPLYFPEGLGRSAAPTAAFLGGQPGAGRTLNDIVAWLNVHLRTWLCLLVKISWREKVFARLSATMSSLNTGIDRLSVQPHRPGLISGVHDEAATALGFPFSSRATKVNTPSVTLSLDFEPLSRNQVSM